MPQLNPSPWFLIMVFSWLVFLTVIPQKITAHTSPNDLNPLNTQAPKTEPWNWPWH